MYPHGTCSSSFFFSLFFSGSFFSLFFSGFFLSRAIQSHRVDRSVHPSVSPLSHQRSRFDKGVALWTRKTENPDGSTGPLARLFACPLMPLTPLTRSLALPCFLHLPALLRSFVHLLAHSLLNGYFFCNLFCSGP